jgi:hypothetical protein
MTEPVDAGASAGADQLAEAERLLLEAEKNPAAAQPAAAAALRGLLLQWAQMPRGHRVGELLTDAARTDDTLEQFQYAATALDEGSDKAKAHEHAKIFVDAARARLANI